MNNEEFAQALLDLKAQNDKAREETLAKIAALEAAVANQGTVTQPVLDAFAALKASVQLDDDVVPDAPVA